MAGRGYRPMYGGPWLQAYVWRAVVIGLSMADRGYRPKYGGPWV
jgi:hypothetical protein